MTSPNTFPADLARGYQSFRNGRLAQERERYSKLADEGQRPQTLLIACCDSRAAPETIFDAAPGEIFVVRNVANLVPDYAPDDARHATSAALEFAVQALKIKNIVVLGHARCGGIMAALDPDMKPLSPGDFIGQWMELLAPAADAVRADAGIEAPARQIALERLSIRRSIENLREFPFVAERERAGELSLHGAWFDISTGELWVLNPASGDFERLDG